MRLSEVFLTFCFFLSIPSSLSRSRRTFPLSLHFRKNCQWLKGLLRLVMERVRQSWCSLGMGWSKCSLFGNLNCAWWVLVFDVVLDLQNFLSNLLRKVLDRTVFKLWSERTLLPHFSLSGAGPIALYSAWLLSKGQMGKYHFWAISLSVAELYGGFMTFSPWVKRISSTSSRISFFLWI